MNRLQSPAHSIAPMPPRLIALLVDIFTIFGVVIVAGIIVAIIDSISSGAAVFAWPAALLIVVLFAFWNVGLRQGGPSGGSIGKSVMGLRLVGAYTGERIGPRRAAVRFLLRPIDFVFAIGLLHAVYDIENQTIVDRILGTIVVAVE